MFFSSDMKFQGRIIRKCPLCQSDQVRLGDHLRVTHKIPLLARRKILYEVKKSKLRLHILTVCINMKFAWVMKASVVTRLKRQLITKQMMF